MKSAVPWDSSNRSWNPVDGTPSGGPSLSAMRCLISATRSGLTSVNLTARAYIGVLLPVVGCGDRRRDRESVLRDLAPRRFEGDTELLLPSRDLAVELA